MTTTKGRRAQDRWATWDKRVRDSMIFALGVIGALNELFIEKDPRPTALVFIGSIIGVPFALKADERRRESQ